MDIRDSGPAQVLVKQEALDTDQREGRRPPCNRTERQGQEDLSWSLQPEQKREALPACTCGDRCADGDLDSLIGLSGPHFPPLKNDSMRLSQWFSGANSESPVGWLEFTLLSPSDPGALGQDLHCSPELAMV